MGTSMRICSSSAMLNTSNMSMSIQQQCSGHGLRDMLSMQPCMSTSSMSCEQHEHEEEAAMHWQLGEV
eukprot:803044-Pelagomonas_calceolata.AAC.7